MKRILILATGGTISCRASASGLLPQLNGAQLLDMVRVPDDIAITVHDILCVDSTDITGEQRLALAQELWQQRGLYDGFVLTHGTDTMAYTAAFLYRALPHFDKPVILTGSQMPMDAADSDAPRNLEDALVCAASAYCGVAVCFAGNLLRGNQVTKTEAWRLDAFTGGNTDCAPDGVVENGQLNMLACPERGTPEWVQPVPIRAATLTVTPLLDADAILSCRGRDVLLLYGYGVGGVPETLVDAVAQLIASGTRVYLGTQCPCGRADHAVYAVGQRMGELGVRSLGARTREDAVACVQCGLL